jgi:hypothetical protein
LSEAAQISALQKSRQERAARWRISSRTFESSIFEISRVIRRLEQDIKNLDSIFAAEVAVEAPKNSWKAWLLSPLYKKAEESSEEKALKDRARQERRIEKDMKERRLDVQKAELKAIETSIRTAESKMKAGDSRDEATIQNILYNLRLKEERERERLARERVAQQINSSKSNWRNGDNNKQQSKQQTELDTRNTTEDGRRSSKKKSKDNGSDTRTSITPSKTTLKLVEQPAATTAGGPRFRAVQHARSVLRVGHTCCNAPAVI